MKGFPHIVSAQAANHLGDELVEEITAEGFVVVPVEEFLRLHKTCDTHLWGQLDEHSVGEPIANLPSPLWRPALSQWNPNPDNPFAAKRPPKMPPRGIDKFQEILNAVRESDEAQPSLEAQARKSRNMQHQRKSGDD